MAPGDSSGSTHYYHYYDDLHGTSPRGHRFTANPQMYEIHQSTHTPVTTMSCDFDTIDSTSYTTELWTRKIKYNMCAHVTATSSIIGTVTTDTYRIYVDNDYGIYEGLHIHGPNIPVNIRGDYGSYIVIPDAPYEQFISKESKEAEEKAKRLLAMLIGDDQLKIYEKTGRMLVKGKSGTKYIVRKGRTVQKIDNDKIIDLCVHINNSFNCPKTDNVIALKLMLEDQEDHILKIANNLGSESLPDKLPLAACM